MAKQSINKPHQNGGGRLAMSVKDAARRLSVSPSFVRQEITRGSIRPVRLGRRVLISEAEIERYVAANTNGTIGGASAKETSKERAR
jgi:excisionase family DNA binding protein